MCMVFVCVISWNLLYYFAKNQNTLIKRAQFDIFFMENQMILAKINMQSVNVSSKTNRSTQMECTRGTWFVHIGMSLHFGDEWHTYKHLCHFTECSTVDYYYIYICVFMWNSTDASDMQFVTLHTIHNFQTTNPHQIPTYIWIHIYTAFKSYSVWEGGALDWRWIQIR